MQKFELFTADVTQWATEYSGPKFHAMLSDFPYDLGFMDEEWDTNAQFEQWGTALLPLLLPGSISLVFGGTRTWHRLASGLENAGFLIWDTMMWLYGTGFPKGQSIEKLLDKKDPKTDHTGWSSHKTPALKPAWEPIICFRTEFNGTYASLSQTYGSGSLNIEAARIPVDGNMGRFPTNVILDEVSASLLDEQSGERPCGTSLTGKEPSTPGKHTYGDYSGRPAFTSYNDSGGASRFFYTAKANGRERNAGMPEGVQNDHPTLKPVALTTYFAKLLLPPPSVGIRRILVPFSGSGSEIIGCLIAGWDEVVGVELSGEFNTIAKHRCTHALNGGYDQFVSNKLQGRGNP